MAVFFDLALIDRTVVAVERVRGRLLRATKALEDAQVAYAVIGGNAVAAWVSTIDPGAIRNTPDVDILFRRADLDAAKQALTGARFVHRHVSGMHMFLDGPDGRERQAIKVMCSGEKILPPHATASPESPIFPGSMAFE